MDFVSVALGSVLQITVLCIFIAGVLKLFQIASTLNEIKELLHGQQRDRVFEQPAPVPAQPAMQGGVMQSGEEMLRALDREMRLGGDEPAIDPEIVR